MTVIKSLLFKLMVKTKNYTHRLQAYQKYNNEIYNKGIVVRHLDGNKLNNSGTISQ